MLSDGFTLDIIIVSASVRQFMSGLVSGSAQSSSVDLVLEREEFEPTVFQLCADNNKVRIYSFIFYSNNI